MIHDFIARVGLWGEPQPIVIYHLFLHCTFCLLSKLYTVVALASAVTAVQPLEAHKLSILFFLMFLHGDKGKVLFYIDLFTFPLVWKGGT